MYIFLALVVGSFYFLNIGSSGSLTTSEKIECCCWTGAFFFAAAAAAAERKPLALVYVWCSPWSSPQFFQTM